MIDFLGESGAVRRALVALLSTLLSDSRSIKNSMVALMGIEKHAAFYRGYEPDQRSLFPVAVVLATLIALWLFVYLVSAVGPQPRPETGSLYPAYTASSSPMH